MTSPMIGITAGVRDENRLFAVNADYVHAVVRAGGTPVLIPPVAERAAACVERLDGLLLSGGPDIDPALYGGVMHEAVYGVNPERDAAEIAALRAAMRRRIPILGICRGAQLINVAFGGTLIEHLSQNGGVVHRVEEGESARHAVDVLPGTLVSRIVGERLTDPVSHHHQAVRALGEGLRAAAYAPDGVVEAIVMPEYSFLVGVQWHPEMTAAEDPAQQAIFNAFVDAARNGARSGGPAGGD